MLAGMVTLTFPSAHTPGHWDRVEFLNAWMVVNNERHHRGAVDPVGRSTERLRIYPALAVEYCDALVGGDIVSYVDGADFSVLGDGTVAWVAGRGPGNGAQYTLRYRARPTFLVWSPQSRDEGGAKMPYRCQAQRLDFFRRDAVGE